MPALPWTGISLNTADCGHSGLSSSRHSLLPCRPPPPLQHKAEHSVQSDKCSLARARPTRPHSLPSLGRPIHQQAGRLSCGLQEVDEVDGRKSSVPAAVRL